MTINKKLVLIFFILVVIPLILAWTNDYLAKNSDFDWGYDHLNTISKTLLAIAILGCIVVIYFNYTSKYNKSFWYSIPIVILIVLAALFYLVYSLSNFGF